MLRKSVLVRVDDLDAPQQARVHEVVRLIPEIERRADWPGLLTFIAAAVGVVVSMIIVLATGLTNFSSELGTGVVVVSAIVFGLSAFFVAYEVCAPRQQRDVAAIMDHAQHSARCRELLDAYLAATPSFQRFLPKPVALPQTT